MRAVLGTTIPVPIAIVATSYKIPDVSPNVHTKAYSLRLVANNVWLVVAVVTYAVATLIALAVLRACRFTKVIASASVHLRPTFHWLAASVLPAIPSVLHVVEAL